jgi:hypothetical protein
MKMIVAAAMAAALLMPAAASAAPGRPKLVSPADGADVQSVPAFSWSKAKRAARYEFQLAADSRFGSIVRKGSFQTLNTAASIDKSLADGTYYWRVRAINAKGDAGKWSERSINKAWGARPALLAPATGSLVPFPSTPLVLRWSSIARAFKYKVYIATDPGLGTLAVSSGRNQPISTSGTVLAPAVSLPPGRYYWAVEPVDASGFPGTRSEIGTFDWTWPSGTATAVSDLISEPVVMDPHMSWNPVPGAVGYDVEVNYSDDWSVGSKVCCTGVNRGTELSPTKVLPNNVYNWRVRAIDAEGNFGQWNVGPDFDKHFGNVPPTVTGLALRDNEGGLAIGASTSYPAVVWSPVPGAASYEYQVAPHDGSICQWGTTGSHVWRDTVTAATAWAPLSPSASPPPDTSYSDVGIATDGNRTLVDGQDYCFRVRARTGDPNVVSDWTQLGGGLTTVGFHYVAAPSSADPLGSQPIGNYNAPAQGSVNPRLPLFSWDAVPGANSYWIVVAKDAAFTQILDVAVTRSLVYAPRISSAPETYPDDTTPYYWIALPASGASGSGAAPMPGLGDRATFVKASQPPARMSPASGADVSGTPVFRWGWSEGAKEYHLQVAVDPTFGNLVDDVRTQATSYTPTEAYPADTVLYWRVRVTDVKDRGLTWSSTGTFRRRLPIPVPAADNPLGGPTIPALSWAPVQGAESYSFHADQSDGTKRDFTQSGTVFTPWVFYGTGVWRWQVRANFPGGASSGWSATKPFTRTIPPPDGVNATYAGGRMVLKWEPSVMAKAYRVEISPSNSFSSLAYRATTENLAIAPPLSGNAFSDGGKLYWRVAAVDEGNNVGGYATGTFKTPKRMIVRLSGGVARGARAQIVVKVTDVKGHAVRGARVKLSGAARAHSRRTNKRGVAKLAARGRRAGTARVTVARSGYKRAVVTFMVP